MACSGSAAEMCGAASRLSIVNVAAAVNASTPANGGGYGGSNGTLANGLVGCFSDYGAGRTYSYISDFLTPDICIRQCLARGSTYAGVNNGNQCICTNTRPAQLSPMSSCPLACTGDNSATCGGSYKAVVYEISKTGVYSGAWKLSPNASGFAGCFQDVNTNRILGDAVFSSNQMTNDICVSNCKSLNYRLAATQGGNQCFCGQAPNATADGAYMVSPGQCSTACKGDAKQMCGGGGKSSIFDIASYRAVGTAAPAAAVEGFKGCYTTGQFVANALFNYSQGTMTPSLCRRTCQVRGYALAGLTNANTCACANDQSQLGAPAVPALCNAACSGDSTSTCGGGFSAYVSLFDTTGTGAYPASNNKEYLGCWLDPDYTTKPVLTSFSLSDRAMTTSMCRNICVSRGNKYYGTEDGQRCYCGNGIPNSGLLPESQCSTNCPGATSEKCGAGSRISVYTSNGAGTPIVVPSASSSAVSSSTSRSASSSSSASGSVSASSSSSSASKSASAFSSSSSASKSVSASLSSSSASKSLSAASSSSSASRSASSASISASRSGSLSNSSSASRSASSSASSSASRSTSSSSSSVSRPASSSSSSVSQAASSSSSSSASRASSSASSSSSVSRSSSSSLTASSTTSALNPALSAGSTDKSYLGCYVAPTRFAFGFPTNATEMAFNSTKFTPESCRTWCASKKYTYAGMTNGTKCGCVNDISTMSAAARGCTVPCDGDKTRMCGGPQAYGMNRVTIPVERRHNRDFRP